MMNVLKTYFFILLALLFYMQASGQNVIDKKGTIIGVDSSKWRLSGANIYNKNTGNVGVGNTSPSYKLDVTGKLRATDSLVAGSARVISLLSGTADDSIVVSIPGSGLLRRISPQRLLPLFPDSTTASNGLSLVGNDVRLGGTLAAPTTIVTSPTNTLSLTGLTGGNIATDSLLAVTSAGVVKRISYPTAALPRIEVDADRTSNYTPSSSYNTIVYNSASVNLGGQYNTSSGIFNVSETGLYQIIVSNMYFGNSAANLEVRNRVIVGGSTVHLETAIGFSPYGGTAVNSTLSMITVMQLSGGDNVRIQVGGEVGTVAPRFATGQHNLKIIRLQ